MSEQRFRKKPVVIEATQWFKNGDHPEDDREWFHTEESGDFLGEGNVVRYFRRPDVSGESLCSECGVRFHDHGWVDTLEDGHRVCPGDWIITGVRGELYPCKPDIFAATYEPADAPQQPPSAADGEEIERTLLEHGPLEACINENGDIAVQWLGWWGAGDTITEAMEAARCEWEKAHRTTHQEYVARVEQALVAAEERRPVAVPERHRLETLANNWRRWAQEEDESFRGKAIVGSMSYAWRVCARELEAFLNTTAPHPAAPAGVEALARELAAEAFIEAERANDEEDALPSEHRLRKRFATILRTALRAADMGER